MLALGWSSQALAIESVDVAKGRVRHRIDVCGEGRMGKGGNIADKKCRRQKGTRLARECYCGVVSIQRIYNLEFV